MTLSIPRRFAAAALAATLACSSPSSPSSPVADVSAYCGSLRGFIAGYFERCEALTAGFAAQLARGTILDCETWAAGVAAGRTVYDPAAAASCLAAITPLGCNQTAAASQLPYDCTLATTGTGGTGAACRWGGECASGQCTLPPACDAEGTCADAPAEGATCAAAAPQCAGGLVCDAGVCRRPPPIPTAAATGASCASAPCVDAAYCGAGDVCVARQGEAQTCSGTLPCAYGLTCTGGVCVRVRLVGEPCTFGNRECQLGAWCTGASTATDAGRCTAYGGPGTQCGLDLRTTTNGIVMELGGCIGGWCDAAGLALGTCQPWLAAGATCDPTRTQCAPEFDCLGTSPTCTRVYCGTL